MKEILEAILHKALGEIRGEVVPQEREEFGHYTTMVVMQLAKERKENPQDIAKDLMAKMHAIAPEGFIAKLDVAGPGFINIWLTDAAIQKYFETVAHDQAFGRNNEHAADRVIVEFSSPNMAKEMHAGHLRNNSLGEALSRIHAANGYQVIRWNYIGDWGTGFGKIIAAYKMWGADLDLREHPVRKLEGLYVRYTDAAKEDKALQDRAREEFRKLEEGDRENRDIWDKFRTASLREIEGIYQKFGIRFDEYIGESFFEKEMEPLIKHMLEKNIAEFSEGAVIVKLDDLGLPPALIRKSDGGSLYVTRDIAALDYRAKTYHPNRLLYVIGNEQTLQFQQLFAIAGMLGIAQGVDAQHVKYGLLLGADGSKMSTREGTSVPITDLADEAITRVRAIVDEKNPDGHPDDKERIADAVGLGALKYYMLKDGRTSDIRFDWESILDFKGDTGPYLMYTYARLKRVVTKAHPNGIRYSGELHPHLADLDTEHELRLMRKIFSYPQEVRRSAEELMTNNLTKYLYELANLANRFYEDQQILTDTNAGRREARILLTDVAGRTLASGLDLLGIEVLDSI